MYAYRRLDAAIWQLHDRARVRVEAVSVDVAGAERA
jgi:hypothetical protein